MNREEWISECKRVAVEIGMAPATANEFDWGSYWPKYGGESPEKCVRGLREDCE